MQQIETEAVCSVQGTIERTVLFVASVVSETGMLYVVGLYGADGTLPCVVPPELSIGLF